MWVPLRLLNAFLVMFLEHSNLVENTQIQLGTCFIGKLAPGALLKWEHFVSVFVWWIFLFYWLAKRFMTVPPETLIALSWEAINQASYEIFQRIRHSWFMLVPLIPDLLDSVPQGCILSIILFSTKINYSPMSLPFPASNSLYMDGFQIRCKSLACNL